MVLGKPKRTRMAGTYIPGEKHSSYQDDEDIENAKLSDHSLVYNAIHDFKSEAPAMNPDTISTPSLSHLQDLTEHDQPSERSQWNHTCESYESESKVGRNLAMSDLPVHGDELYRLIENFTSEDAVRSLLGELSTPNAKLSLLEYRSKDNITTLQLVIQKSKLLSETLVQHLFDVYIDNLRWKFPNEDAYIDFIDDIRHMRNLKPNPAITPFFLDTDPHGFTLLHYAILYNSSAWNIRQLIDLFREKGLLNKALYKSEKCPITPLHLAILSPLGSVNQMRSPNYIIKLLLDADGDGISLFEYVDIREPDNAVLRVSTPLHLAILCKKSFMEIKVLIDADCTGKKEWSINKQSLVTSIGPGEEKCYPLQAAIKNNLPENVIKILVDADWSSDGRTRINVLPLLQSGKLPKHLVPIIMDDSTLSYLLPDDTSSPKTEDRLFQNDKTSPKTEDRPTWCIPEKYLPELASNPAMQHYLNKNLCITYAFAFLLLFDFYVHVLSVLFFMLNLENRQIWVSTRVLLYITASLLLAREIIEMNFYGLTNWMKSPIHWIELTYCFLIFFCITRITNIDEDFWTKNQRNTILITGGLSWIMPLLSLRVMFKSFALFFWGVLNIIRTLVPFVVSGLFLIGAFAVMYQVDSLNGQESFKICNILNSTQLNATLVATQMPLSQSCPYWESFGNVSYFVLTGFNQEFLTKPTTTTTKAISISFAILAAILLLNVIIAIINLKWEEVTNRGLKVFWFERAKYLELVLGLTNPSIWNKIKLDIQDVLFFNVTVRERLFGIISVPLNLFIIIVWWVYGLCTFGIFWPRTVRYSFIRMFPYGREIWWKYRTIFVDQTDISSDDPLKKGWDHLTGWITTNKESVSFPEKILALIKFLFAVFLMSIWLIAGLAFGLLWPRQVREYLFCPEIEKKGKEGICGGNL